MSLVVELSPELEAELTVEANRLNLPLADYALRVLSTVRIPESTPTNGGELVTYWHNEGLVGSRSDINDAPEHARELRKRAEERERS